jgi:hypothetical protein
VRKLRDADAMLNSGKDVAAVLQSLEVSESTLDLWRALYGGMKAEEASVLRSWRMRTASSSSLWTSRRWTSGCSSTLWRETGKPFPEAGRGLGTSREVPSLRAKGVQGVRSTAERAALRGQAARRRAKLIVRRRELAGKRPRFGYRRIAALLRRKSWQPECCSCNYGSA